ncbi:MAG TPA: hypothetical protein VHM67_03070 [Gemmatimonadaceae bacterium]|nr:hypothetical protein [Gemmatimonadaceae bacterium]
MRTRAAAISAAAGTFARRACGGPSSARAAGLAAHPARSLGASQVELYSNTVLKPAISLYRSLGFVEVPLPHNDFERANIKMVLSLRS